MTKNTTLIDLIPANSPNRAEAESLQIELCELCAAQVALPIGSPARSALNEPIMKIVCRIKTIESRHL